MIILSIIIASLILLNFLLLKFSCDCADSQLNSKKTKLKVRKPKAWIENSSQSNPVFADK
jgi:hypothetical protein